MNRLIEEIYIILSLVAGAQGIFLTIMLFFAKKNSLANRIISIAVFFLAFQHIVIYFVLRDFETEYPVLVALLGIFDLTFGPLFYLYICLLTSKIRKIRLKDLLHFIPFLLYILLMVPFLLSNEDEQLKFVQMFYDQNLPPEIIIIHFLLYVQMFTYMGFILKRFKNYRKNIKDYFTNIERVNLKWLRIVIIFILFSWITYFVSFLCYLVDFDLSLFIDIIYTFFNSVFIYMLGYIALNQPELLKLTSSMSDTLSQDRNKSVINNNAAEYTNSNLKYQASSLSAEDSLKYYEEIKKIMDEEKLYANPEFVLADLEIELPVGRSYVSQVINENFGKSFYEFVNQYRIDEVKKSFRDETKADQSILDLAFRAGFNSKSSFNNVFKKYTGMTPSQYKKSLANN